MFVWELHPATFNIFYLPQIAYLWYMWPAPHIKWRIMHFDGIPSSNYILKDLLVHHMFEVFLELVHKRLLCSSREIHAPIDDWMSSWMAAEWCWTKTQVLCFGSTTFGSHSYGEDLCLGMLCKICSLWNLQTASLVYCSNPSKALWSHGLEVAIEFLLYLFGPWRVWRHRSDINWQATLA